MYPPQAVYCTVLYCTVLYCVLCRRQVESITSDLTSSIISELSLSQANYSQLSEVKIVL